MRKDKIYKFLSFLPAIFMMYIIFGFSGDTGEESSSLSARVTEQVIMVLEQITPEVIPEGQAKEKFAYNLQGVIRKLAHMAEYALLTITWLFALWVNGLKGKKQLLITLLICFAYACTDEIHQLYVPGRSGKFTDVCIDMVGVGSVLFLVWIKQKYVKVKRNTQVGEQHE